MRTALTLVFTLCFCGLMTAQVYVNANATGNNDGSSWADAYSKLQTAIDSSAANSELWIAAGTYFPQAVADLDTMTFTIDKPIALYGGFEGTETMLEERDHVANLTRLSGDIDGDDVPGDVTIFRTDNARHVLVILLEEPGEVTLDGLDISNGAALLEQPPAGTPDITPWLGGGVLSLGGLRLNNCTFTDNTAFIGGAFYSLPVSDSLDQLFVTGCEIDSNHSGLGTARFQGFNTAVFVNTTVENNRSDFFGGGVVLGNSNAIFEGCAFRNNTAEQSVGGGLFGFQNSANTIIDPTVSIRNCSFEDNIAIAGGGLTYNNFFPGGAIFLDSCEFTGNATFVAQGAAAGGALIQNVVDPSGTISPSLAIDVDNTIFEDNTSPTAGGLFVYTAPDSDGIIAEVSNTLFAENTGSGAYGGAVFFNDESFFQLALNNVGFEDNEGGQIGGGLNLVNGNDEARLQYTMDNCVFDGNNAEYGGAMWSDAIITSGSVGTITNCEFYDNTASACCGAIGSIEETVSIDNSIFEGNSTQAVDEDINGGGAIYFLANRARVTNSVFIENGSEEEGSAIMVRDGEKVFLENLLLEDNMGASAVSNGDSLWMTNLTFVGNNGGLSQNTGGVAILQNNIFDNDGGNYRTEMDSTISVISNGANLSTDSTFLAYFTGSGTYLDYNNTDPELDSDLVPGETSVCVDTGNPDGVDWLVDLEGVDRIQGVSVDIGAFESPFDTPVRNLNTLDISVYPNPFVQNIQLSSIDKMQSIRLLDLQGRMVQQFPIEQTLRINTTLPVGLYFLEVVIEGQAYFKKLEKM